MRIGGKHPYGMSQTGGIGSQQIHAWAFGSLAGYTWFLIPGRLASDYSLTALLAITIHTITTSIHSIRYFLMAIT